MHRALCRCNNIFYIKSGHVRYSPIGTGGARCYTNDATTRTFQAQRHIRRSRWRLPPPVARRRFLYSPFLIFCNNSLWNRAVSTNVRAPRSGMASPSSLPLLWQEDTRPCPLPRSSQLRPALGMRHVLAVSVAAVISALSISRFLELLVSVREKFLPVALACSIKFEGSLGLQ